MKLLPCAALLGAALGLLVTVLPLRAQNLVQNPGFESGTTGWTAFGGSLSSTTTRPHSGAQSAYVQNRTATWNGVAQSFLGVVQTNNDYRISAWIWIETNTAQNAKLTMRKIDSGTTTYNNVATITAQPGQWNQLTGGFTLSPPTNLTDLTLYLEGPAAGVSFYADDFVVEAYDWRQQADARIEQNRKRDFRLLVLDRGGQPVPGVQVSARQTRHRFAFGSAINGNISKAAYASFFRTNFEWAVMENESKWYYNEPSQGYVTYTAADAITNFCYTNGITLRGHCLFWAVRQNVQSWVTNLSNSSLTNAISNRLASAVSHFRKTFVHWDVNNELLHGDYFGDRLGDWVNPWMFQEARRRDPDVTLFVNDYNVVAGGETEAYKDQIRGLVAANAPVGGIGAQGHYSSPVSPILTETRLDSLAELGLPIWITEYDYVSADENDRANQLETLYRVAFSKPAVEGILMWGFWAGSHWRGSNAAIVNLDWSLNEAGRRYQSLLREWTTVTNGSTAADGSFGFRGFHGSYDVTLTPPGGEATLRRITVEPGTNSQAAAVAINTTDNRPLLTAAAVSAIDGRFRFCLNADAGRGYRIETSSNLPGGWTLLTNVVNPSGTLWFTDTTPATAGRLFWRAMALP